MTMLEAVLATVVVGWMAVLSLVVVLLVRQTSLLTVRVTAASNRLELDNDGPRIGSKVDSAILRAPLSPSTTFVVVMSATCKPCHELVEGVEPQAWPSRMIAVLTGPPAAARDLARRLPTDTKLLIDDEARDAAGHLGISSLPFGVLVQDDVVIDKGYLSNRVDLDRLLKRSDGFRESSLLNSIGGNGLGR